MQSQMNDSAYVKTVPDPILPESCTVVSIHCNIMVDIH